MQTVSLYREIAVAFLECAKHSTAASERDRFLAAAVHYHKRAREIEDAERARTDETSRLIVGVARAAPAQDFRSFGRISRSLSTSPFSIPTSAPSCSATVK
jgi:hypothetical protein